MRGGWRVTNAPGPHPALSVSPRPTETLSACGPGAEYPRGGVGPPHPPPRRAAGDDGEADEWEERKRQRQEEKQYRQQQREEERAVQTEDRFWEEHLGARPPLPHPHPHPFIFPCSLHPILPFVPLTPGNRSRRWPCE